MTKYKYFRYAHKGEGRGVNGGGGEGVPLGNLFFFFYNIILIIIYLGLQFNFCPGVPGVQSSNKHIMPQFYSIGANPPPAWSNCKLK